MGGIVTRQWTKSVPRCEDDALKIESNLLISTITLILAPIEGLLNDIDSSLTRRAYIFIFLW